MDIRKFENIIVTQHLTKSNCRGCKNCRCTVSQNLQSHLLCFQVGLIKTLEYIADLLKFHKIPFWILSGTLIGALRNGKIIPWDHDFDLGVWMHDVPKVLALKQEIRKAGFGFNSNRYEQGGYYRFAIHSSQDCSFHGDFFPFVVKNNIAYTPWDSNYFHYTKELENLTEIKFEGRLYPCAQNAVEPIKRAWPDWKVLKPYHQDDKGPDGIIFNSNQQIIQSKFCQCRSKYSCTNPPCRKKGYVK